MKYTDGEISTLIRNEESIKIIKEYQRSNIRSLLFIIAVITLIVYLFINEVPAKINSTINKYEEEVTVNMNDLIMEEN